MPEAFEAQNYLTQLSVRDMRGITLATTEQEDAMAANNTLDRLVGLTMLIIASTVFLYYTIWTLLMPFVDEKHAVQSLFPPRVWAIRIPVILLLLGGAVVGSFLSVIMIRSNRKKAAKAAQKKSK